MPVRRCAQALLLFILLIGSAGYLRAAVTGAVSGLVHDAQGGGIPGAAVTITNTATNQVASTVSGADGQYNFLSLVPGNYKLSITAAGFNAASVQNIDVKVNDQLRYDINLVIGDVAQTVSVEANAVQVQTSNTQLGGTIESKEMLSLPLNGRSYLDLLGLQAGVAPRPSNSAATDRPLDSGLATNSGNVSVNGQPESANAFLVNGGDVSETKNNGAGLIPNIDSVAEFRLLTNSFDAEYGKFTGAVMNTVTKSGTNGIHGDGFEFYRNDAMDAKTYTDNQKAALTRHQYGYAVGGPFWRDHLFWFTDYQGSRQTQGASTGTLATPTAAQQQGNIAPSLYGTKTVQGAYWANILSQRLGQTVNQNQTYASLFANGIPARAFDPIAVKELSFIPPPNNGTTYSNASLNNTIHDDKAGQRVDVNTQHLGVFSFYYLFDDSSALNQYSAANSSLPGFATVNNTRGQMLMVSNTKTIGSTMVNEARITAFRSAFQQANPVASSAGNQVTLAQLGYNNPSGLGINFSGPAGYTQSVPQTIFSSYQFGNPLTNMKAVDNNFMGQDTFSKVLGNHNLKMGGEFRYYQLIVRNVCAPNGQFTFTNGAGGETGYDFADFLLGAPSGYVQCSEQLLDNRARYGGAFFQDGWKARPNLTLNLGIRYEIPVPWYDKYNQLDTFIPGVQSTVFPLAPKGNLFPGDPGVAKSISPTFYNRFAPRIGIAFAPNGGDGMLGKLLGNGGTTSIRAAFGIYYLGAADSANFGVIGSAPYGLYWTSTAQPLLDEPFRTRGTGISQTQRFPFNLPRPGDPNNAKLDFSIFEPLVGPGLNTNNKLAYAEHYNLSIQRQLSKSTVLTLAYVGTGSRHLQGDLNINPGDPNLCNTLAATAPTGTTKCGPNAEKSVFTGPNGPVYGSLVGMGNQALGKVAFGKVHLYSNIGSSSYNSFQASIERKARYLSILGAYTYGKSIDNVSTVFYANDLTRNRAVSPFDVKHNFVASYNVMLPFDKFGGPKRLTEGWTISGITRFATGFPITVSQAGDLALTGYAFDFPNYNNKTTKLNPRTNGKQFFTTAGFSTEAPIGSNGQPQYGMVGNSNPRPIYGPGILNTDAGITKRTRITETTSLELRGEFFNVFNHAQFTTVQGSFSSSQFGQVTLAAPGRIGQVSAKFLF